MTCVVFKLIFPVSDLSNEAVMGSNIARGTVPSMCPGVCDLVLSASHRNFLSLCHWFMAHMCHILSQIVTGLITARFVC